MSNKILKFFALFYWKSKYLVALLRGQDGKSVFGACLPAGREPILLTKKQPCCRPARLPRRSAAADEGTAPQEYFLFDKSNKVAWLSGIGMGGLLYLGLIPFALFAQNYPPNIPNVNYNDGQPAAIGNISSLLSAFSGWLSTIAVIVLGLGVVVFFWGIVRYMTSAGDEEKRKDARANIIFGIIGLFVMVSIWGIIYFLGGILGIEPGGSVPLPGVPCVIGSPGCVPPP